MNRSVWKRAAVALAAAALVTAVAGCQDGDTGTRSSGASAPAKPGTQSAEQAAQALRTAHTKAAEARSARVRMRLSVAGGTAPGSSTFTGVQAWGPQAAELKVSDSSYLAAIPGAPAETRVVTTGGTTYVDLGADLTAQTGGKRWLKAQPEGAAAGDELMLQLTGGLAAVNMDLPKELGLLAGSSAVEHLGPAKGGVRAEAYRGELPDGRTMEVWIGPDGFPVKSVVRAESGGSVTSLTTTYAEYGAEAGFRAPPAGDTVDFVELLKKVLAGGGRG
ncbi:hypothetical protein EAO70_28625 [Streptomyces sp. adm13(2018)]|uniref:hypothetical protein n=1 Tax=Streptomyces sp. adm13(2018) TaxID=2479007 RepID=UPI0011CEADE7|nr:hypothetical protein [Streptomyces sp. adm13(2018)]TXS10966.1 hypothetical protein EAO70_28625 [Streptomyces sp. adm13(2018)]